MRFRIQSSILATALFILSIFLAQPVQAQSVASGTVEGTVADPTGAVVSGAKVEIRNPLTGYQQATTTDTSGVFRFSNLPFNNYHIEITQQGFAAAGQDVNVRSTVPASVKVTLTVAGVTESVTVEATGADILENVPYAHSDVDVSTLNKLPTLSPASGLSDAIILSSPGVVADSNGFFHPLGDHAQTSFAIDGQPISDQQSKAFSTQIPVNAIQSMELITGTPTAEYGDKTSLVVNATTRSGLGLAKPTGSFQTEYSSFGTISEAVNFGAGGQKAGYFLAANGVRSGRFLDTPEFRPIHAIGNSGDIFNRFDFNLGPKDSFHTNFLLARNWFQVPNTLDQPNQDQRQKVVTFNLAPGYQHTFSTSALLTLNPFVRQDRVHFYPSADPFDDSPATLAQSRRLTNWGLRGDVSYVKSHHNLKIGGQVMQTRLTEAFGLGLTDPLLNPVCVNAAGEGQELPTVTNPANCARSGAGFRANPGFLPGLLPLDLTRGGSLFQFAANGNVNEYAAYIQDSITVGKLTLSPGLRVDHYVSPSATDTGVQPRVGISYLISATGTVLRAGYARTFETPYNENLLLSSTTGVGGLTDVFGAQGQAPLHPGRRNQYNVGLQQALGRYIQVDGDYFWKFTTNAYDFDVLFNTPVQFPISWRKSKIDGVSFRVSTTNIKGFQWYTTMGHNRSRFFGPEVGGLLFNSPVDAPVFRIDHDQAFQQTSNIRYQWKKDGPWAGFTWRYDSGLVAGAVAGLDDLLALTAAQQAAVGFFCGSTVATPDSPISACGGSNFGATRLKIPAPGTADDDHNPTRIAPRHLFDIGGGTDNLLRSGDSRRVTLRFTVSNVGNKIALYNFLSTFSGTHFVAPRSYQGSIGFVF